jgi:hypothetical protein
MAWLLQSGIEEPIPGCEIAGPRLGLPAAALFLVAAALLVTRTGRDALYVQEGGVAGLPLAYLGVALLAPLFAMAALWAMLRFGGRAVRAAAPLLMAALQLSVPLWAAPGPTPAMTLLFILVPVVYGVLLSSAWLLAAEMAQSCGPARTRAFALFGASAMLGSLCGAGLARAAAQWVEPSFFFVLGAALLIGAALTTLRAQSRFPSQSPPAKRRLDRLLPFAALGAASKDRFVRTLVLAVAAASMAGVVVEFLFYLQVGSAHSGQDPAIHFADIYLYLNASGLALQLLVLPSVQSRAGLGSTLVFTPFLLAGAGLLFTLRLLPAGGLRIAEGGLKSSFYRSSWEQSYTLVADNVRGIVKILVDGVASRAGEGLAAAALLLVVRRFGIPAEGAGAFAVHALLLSALAAWVAGILMVRRLIHQHEVCVGEAHLDPEHHPMEGCSLTATLGRHLA